MRRPANGEEFAADARDRLADARGALTSMQRNLRDSGRSARQAFNSSIKAGQAKLRAVFEQAQHAAQDAHREVSARVRERPLVYTGGALAAGFVLGAILSAMRR